MILLLATLFAPGCAHTPPVDVPLAPPVATLPFTDPTADSPLRVTSELTATFRRAGTTTSERMLVVLERRDAALHVVGLTPAGIPLFTLTQYGDGRLETQALAAAPGLAPERILADLQLCLWPFDLLNQHLPAEFTVDQTDTARILRHRGRTLITVSYSDNVSGDFAANARLGVTLEHRVLGYRIRVRPLESG
jgi:hypothetical protein